MERDDLMWLAGLLEGEGCFDFYRWSKHPAPRIRVVMTDPDVVQRVASLFSRKMTAAKRRTTGGKTAYYTGLVGKDAAALMELLRPLMGQRRRERIEAVLAQNHTSAR